MLERSQQEIHAMQTDINQSWLRLDFPKVLARLSAQSASSPSSPAGASQALTHASTSEGDLIAVNMSSSSPPLPSRRHCSTSPMPSPMGQAAQTNAVSSPMSFSSPGSYRKSETTASSQTVGMDGLGAGNVFGAGLETISTESLRGGPSGRRGRGRGRGGAEAGGGASTG